MQNKFVLTADASKHDHIKGSWQSGISIYKGDWYTSGNKVYECILAHISVGGNQPPNATYWILVIPAGTPLGSVSWKGAWSGATTYAAGDGCTYSSKAYVSIVGGNLNHVPPNVTYWIEVYYTYTGDVVGPGSAVSSDMAEFDGTTGKLIKDGALTHANVADAITKKHTQAADDNFNTLTAKTAFVNDDLLLIYSIADAAYRKMTLGNAKKMVLLDVPDTGTVQTLTQNVDTKITTGLSATPIYDTLSGWDGINKKYVCKEAGVYLLIASTVVWGGAANGYGAVHVWKNTTGGTRVLEGLEAIVANVNTGVQPINAALVVLALNDTLELYAAQTASATLSCQWGNHLLLAKVA